MVTSTLEVRPTSDSHFAWLRTKMSCDRTLMSWVRTAVSMVGFGFTIVQFFDRFKSIEGVKEAAHTGAPRLLGMMLIGAGTIGLAISVWQYHTIVAELRSDAYRVIAPDRQRVAPVYALAVVTIFIGVFAFFAVATRMM
jgi:inner membrane protein YidH